MSAVEMYLKLKTKLGDVVPDVELRYKAQLADQINRLKKDRNAVILGHNYMEPALFHSCLINTYPSTREAHEKG